MLRRAVVVLSTSLRQVLARHNVAKQGLPLQSLPRTAAPILQHTPARLTSVLKPAVPQFWRQPFASASVVHRMQQSYVGVNYARLAFCHNIHPSQWSQALLKRDLSTMVQSQLSRCLLTTLPSDTEAHNVTRIDQVQLGKLLAKGSNGEIFACRLRDIQTAGYLEHIQPVEENDHPEDWPLVCKRNFTYKGQKYSLQPEILPLLLDLVHPGIVQQLSHFRAKSMKFEDFFHNETQHILMKRYCTNLSKFLEERQLNDTEATSILLQLLEVDVFLKKNNIAHRDIKADNILVTENADGSIHACLADFGCSLNQLTQSDIDHREGNSCLMAPEIQRASTGPLDYSKADLWAIGTIAYQLFGQENPFYESASQKHLDSKTYEHSQLPALVSPTLVTKLVSAMLQPDPQLRPTSQECANLLHFNALASSLPPPKNFAEEHKVTDWLFCCVAKDILSRSWLAKLRATFYERCWDFEHLIGLNRRLNLINCS